MSRPVRSAVLALVVVALAGGCRGISTGQAREMVERYNRAVTEAYRRGDVRLIDSVVGPNEGKKLTGLIGARMDMGITLDARLLALDVTGVEQTKDEVRVRTKERWRYRDLRIGSGELVGEESEDAYEMLYLFRYVDRAWVVDEIRFTAPPQVGRRAMPWGAAHGAEASASVEGAKR